MLDALCDSVECGREEVQVQLARVLPPLVQQLRAPARDGCETHALSLLCTLCEQRGELAGELRAAGAVRLVAAHLLQGVEEVQDVAAHAMWLLVRDKQDELLGSEGAERELGCTPTQLTMRLAKLVQTAEVEEVRWQGGGAVSGGRTRCLQQRQVHGPGCTLDHAAHDPQALRESENDAASVDGGTYDDPPPSADICYASDAQALLRALAAHHPDVQRLIEEKEVPLARGRSCCVM